MAKQNQIHLMGPFCMRILRDIGFKSGSLPHDSRGITCMCLATFHSVAWVMPQGWDFGALGCPGRQKKFFFKHGHVAYQIDEDDEQNRMQVKFSSYGQTGNLGVRSKVKY